MKTVMRKTIKQMKKIINKLKHCHVVITKFRKNSFKVVQEILEINNFIQEMLLQKVVKKIIII